MTTTTRNEAAERPECTCAVIENEPHADDCAALIYSRRIFADNLNRQIEDALAAERRATVERIRDRYELEEFDGWADAEAKLGGAISETKLLRILDEEVAR